MLFLTLAKLKCPIYCSFLFSTLQPRCQHCPEPESIYAHATPVCNRFVLLSVLVNVVFYAAATRVGCKWRIHWLGLWPVLDCMINWSASGLSDWSIGRAKCIAMKHFWQVGSTTPFVHYCSQCSALRPQKQLKCDFNNAWEKSEKTMKLNSTRFTNFP